MCEYSALSVRDACCQKAHGVKRFSNVQRPPEHCISHLNSVWYKLLLVAETSPHPTSGGGGQDSNTPVAVVQRAGCVQTQAELLGQHFLPKQTFLVTARRKSIGQMCVASCKLDQAALYHQ